MSHSGRLEHVKWADRLRITGLDDEQNISAYRAQQVRNVSPGCRRTCCLVKGKEKTRSSKDTARDANCWQTLIPGTKFYRLIKQKKKKLCQNDGRSKEQRIAAGARDSQAQSNKMNAEVYRSILGSASVKCIKTHWVTFHHSAGQTYSHSHQRVLSRWGGGIFLMDGVTRLISVWLSSGPHVRGRESPQRGSVDGGSSGGCEGHHQGRYKAGRSLNMITLFDYMCVH